MGFMDAAAPIVLIRSGLPKASISQIAIVSFFCTFWIPIYIGKYISGKKKENRLCVQALTYQTVNMAIFGLTLYQFKQLKGEYG